MEIICEHPKRGTGKPETVASFKRQSSSGQWVEVRHRTRGGKRVRPRLSIVLDGDDSPSDLSVAALRWIRNHGTPSQHEAVADYRESLSLRCKICGSTVPVQEFSALVSVLDQLEAFGLETATMPQVRYGIQRGLGNKA